MSSTQAFPLTITWDNCQSYLVGQDAVDIQTPLGDHNAIAGIIILASGTTGYANLNDTAKNILFPNSTAKPVSADYYLSGYATYLGSNYYVSLQFAGNTVDSLTFSSQKRMSVRNTSTASFVTNLQKSNVIRYYCKKNKRLTYQVGVGVDDTLSITLYFTRYDFQAVAGDNISSISVSRSTGYDGDQITYSCETNGGAFLGWYNGSTLVSSDQTYVHTVNGADLTLTAKASAPTTKTLSATYNGAQLSSFPISVSGDVAIAYNGSSIGTVPFYGGTKTLNCAGKLMSGTVTLGGKTLNCSGKVMATDVVATISQEET